MIRTACPSFLNSMNVKLLFFLYLRRMKSGLERPRTDHDTSGIKVALSSSNAPRSRTKSYGYEKTKDGQPNVPWYAPGRTPLRRRGRCHRRGVPDDGSAPLAHRRSAAVRDAADSRSDHVGRKNRVAARPQPVEPLAVARGELLVASRAGTGKRGLHRGDQRLGPVHRAHRWTKSPAPDRVQHRVADGDCC